MMSEQPKPRFLPPGGLTCDLGDDETLLDAWSAEIANGLDATIAGLGDGDVLLFNPLKISRDDLQPRQVAWITMPAFLANGRERPDALREADQPAEEGTLRRQDEYSEWFTHRDGEKRVVAIDVTTELPEYWTFLAGKRPDEVVALYKRYVSAEAERDALFNGDVYNPVNAFNSSRGAMHMTTDINNLGAALGVIGEAVRLRNAGDELIDVQFCSRFPTIGANADPTLYANVNRLARELRPITLQNPIGVYILGIDLDGWLRPDGKPVTYEDVVADTRGTPPVRIRIEGRGFALWESTVGGEPLEWGSQIAERLTVGVVFAVGPSEERNPDRDVCMAITGSGGRRA
jgi:hypothetical protein